MRPEELYISTSKLNFSFISDNADITVVVSLKSRVSTCASCSLSAFFSFALKKLTKSVTFERESTRTNTANITAILVKILNQRFFLSPLNLKLVPHSVNGFKVRGAVIAELCAKSGYVRVHRAGVA